jgi:mannosyl-oligosaccharide alpha-1,2-mannosidase
MWPSYVDASGCERIIYKSPNLQVNGGSSVQRLDIKGNPIEAIPPLEQLQEPSPVTFSSGKGPTAGEEPQEPPVGGKAGRIHGWDENHPGSPEKAASSSEKMDENENVSITKPDPLIFEAKPPSTKVKRQSYESLEETSPDSEPAGYNDRAATVPEINIPLARTSPEAVPTHESLPECIPHGLGSQGKWGTDEFTLGSLADSTYEYFPKVSQFQKFALKQVELILNVDAHLPQRFSWPIP